MATLVDLVEVAAVVLPIGPRDRQVQLIRRSGKPDTLALSPATDQWLRHGYSQRIVTEAARLGEEAPEAAQLSTRAGTVVLVRTGDDVAAAALKPGVPAAVIRYDLARA